MTFMMFLARHAGSLSRFSEGASHRGEHDPADRDLYNIGAVVGAIIFGQLSQHLGVATA
jgi:hypothetical protein